MNYMMIRTDDMLNGDGLRVVLFCTACNHHCKGCHNPETWDKNNGIPFNNEAKNELFEELNKDYISGITLSGGDPLHENNVHELLELVKEIKQKFPNKTVWIYSGYTWENIFAHSSVGSNEVIKTDLELTNYQQELVKLCDVFIDGTYVEQLADVNYPWAGSTNQRVIDVKKSLKSNNIVRKKD